MAQNEKLIKSKDEVELKYYPLGDKQIKSNKRIGPHNRDVLSVLVGNLLGDSYAEKRNKLGGVRFIIQMSQKNREYLNWLHKFYAERGYCSNKIRKYKKQISSNGTIYYNGKFNTWTFNNLVWLYDLFYYQPNCLIKVNNIKRVPSCISSLLTPLAIAIWFMNNGSKYNKTSIRFNTHSLILEELKILQKAFWDLYKINVIIRQTSLNSNQYILVINNKSKPKFINLVYPHILPSKRYKLPI